MISAMVMTMSMTGINASAQPRGRERGKDRVERREPRKEPNCSTVHNRPGNSSRPDRIAHAPKPKDRKDNHFVPRGGRLLKCAPPRVDHGCYVPGWEGRVKHLHDGRWAYYVDGCWRYYDCYYNPKEFFCEPVPTHIHTSPRVYTSHASTGEVAAGVVAGAILGCVMGALAN